MVMASCDPCPSQSPTPTLISPPAPLAFYLHPALLCVPVSELDEAAAAIQLHLSSLLLRADDIDVGHADIHPDFALYALAGLKQEAIEVCTPNESYSRQRSSASQQQRQQQRQQLKLAAVAHLNQLIALHQAECRKMCATAAAQSETATSEASD